MKARRTPWWYYLVALAVGLGAGAGLAKIGEATRVSLIGAPWIVPAMLALLGIVVLVLALQVHKYATTEPAKRQSTIDPQRAVYTLVLAKALGVAGAALTGWYGGQILMSLAHADASFYSNVIRECLFTGAVCIADMIIGVVGEWLCQLPPDDGPDNPASKARRQRALGRAAAKDAASNR